MGENYNLYACSDLFKVISYKFTITSVLFRCDEVYMHTNTCLFQADRIKLYILGGENIMNTLLCIC